MRIFVSLLAGSLLALTSTQSVLSKDHIHLKQVEKSKFHKSGFVKPGAAINLSHDYDGKTAVGEFENVTVRLDHIYQDGTISVDLLSPSHIQISAFQSVHDMPVYSGSFLELPIQFSGLKAGSFTVSLEVVYKTPMGNESRRVASIPLNIGGETLGKAAHARNDEITPVSKQGLIGLPAIEVIE